MTAKKVQKKKQQKMQLQCYKTFDGKRRMKGATSVQHHCFKRQEGVQQREQKKTQLEMQHEC